MSDGVAATSPDQLKAVLYALRSNGFRDAGLFQIWKPGQVFGYLKRLSGRFQWHVRGFANGLLESEIEHYRWSVKHLTRTPKPYLSPLIRLLFEYRIPCWPVNYQYPIVNGKRRSESKVRPSRLTVPRVRTTRNAQPPLKITFS